MTYSREYNREYQLARYHRIRFDAIQSAGGKCVACGSCDNLEFHHKDPSIKSFDVSVSWSLSKDKLAAELKKCELRCTSCHKRVHEADHGTISKYNHYKCRCSLCKAVWNKYIRDYKWARRQEAKGTAL